MKLLKKLGVLPVLAGLFFTSFSAHAMVVTDGVGWSFSDPFDVVEIGSGESYTYTHDLTDNGVPEDYLVTSGSLELYFADDSFYDGEEEATVTVVDFTSDSFDVDGLWVFFFAVAPTVFEHVLEVSGIASLNDDGLLDVTLSSVTGDFIFKKSILTATLTPVDAPETLALFSMGLAGLVWYRRRKAKSESNGELTSQQAVAA